MDNIRYHIHHSTKGWYYTLTNGNRMVDVSDFFHTEEECTKEAIKDKQRMENRLARNAVANHNKG